MTLSFGSPRDPQAQWNDLVRTVKQLAVDVMRLLRDQQTYIQSPADSPGPFGTESAGSKAFVQLSAPLYRGQTASAAVLVWSGAAWSAGSDSVQVDGTFTRGYWFTGEWLEVERHGSPVNRWYAKGTGQQYVTGTLSGAVALNGTATITVDGSSGKTITATAKFGAGTSGNPVGASWNEYQRRWEFTAEKCG